MRIFVQHCGFKQHQDYSWQQWSDAAPDQPPTESADAEWDRQSRRFAVADCITTEDFSLALARSKGELLLVITALPTNPARTDLAKRRLRATIAWISPGDEQHEAAFRSLAAQALTDFSPLVQKVDTCFRFSDAASGFAADFSALKALAEVRDHLPSLHAEWDYREAHDSAENRNSLAAELKERRLPDVDGPLVAVSHNLDPEQLPRVWRVASALIAAQTWQKKSSNRPQFHRIVGGIVVCLLAVGLVTYAAWPILLSSFSGKPRTTNRPPIQTTSNGASSADGKDVLSPALSFRRHAASTPEADRSIVLDSIEEKDSAIEYKTTDGKRWRVGYAQQSDGSYRFDAPKPRN